MYPEEMAYLMFDERTFLAKIGRSRNPEFREKTLQSDNPLITLLGVFLDGRATETRLHRIFSKKRIRGEWFDLEQADYRFLLEMAHDCIDDVRFNALSMGVSYERMDRIMKGLERVPTERSM